MISFEFNIFSFIGVLIVGYIINLMAMWFTHFIMHQTILGIPTYTVHFNAHHRLEWESIRGYEFYLWAILEHSTWFLFGVVYLVLYYFLFTDWIAYTLMSQLALVTVMTYYLHNEYEKKNSWFNRYHWFRKDRAQHGIHHKCPYENFHDGRNYSFGGPLGHLPDQLFGTFQASKKG